MLTRGSRGTARSTLRDRSAARPLCDHAGVIATRRYHQPVQEYVLSELDTGERLITEKVSTVRSVSLGFWIGVGSRDEPEAKAG